MMNLKSPVTYQGGKSRLAAAIVDIIGAERISLFVEGCCGSGAVSIELVRRGFATSAISMYDAGPWGIFWNLIGCGAFNLSTLRLYTDAIPRQLGQVQGFLRELQQQPAAKDTAYVFLVLQAGAFGGKAVSITESGTWRTPGFRSAWLPTATSSRRSAVNPMMPMSGTLYERCAALSEAMAGVRAEQADIRSIPITASDCVYLDPPYQGVTGYAEDFSVPSFIARCPARFVAVSEREPLSKESVRLSGGRLKGGISGDRDRAHEEWLSIFRVGERGLC